MSARPSTGLSFFFFLLDYLEPEARRAVLTTGPPEKSYLPGAFYKQHFATLICLCAWVPNTLRAHPGQGPSSAYIHSYCSFNTCREVLNQYLWKCMSAIMWQWKEPDL